MPLIQISLQKGRSPELIADLIKRTTRSVSETLDVEESKIRVLIYEIEPEHWGIGGLPASDQNIQ